MKTTEADENLCNTMLSRLYYIKFSRVIYH